MRHQNSLEELYMYIQITVQDIHIFILKRKKFMKDALVTRATRLQFTLRMTYYNDSFVSIYMLKNRFFFFFFLF